MIIFDNRAERPLCVNLAIDFNLLCNDYRGHPTTSTYVTYRIEAGPYATTGVLKGEEHSHNVKTYESVGSLCLEFLAGKGASIDIELL